MICIYAIINIIDDKLYVGQAADKDYRWREHRKQLRGFYHHNLYLQRAWSKYGEQNFIFVVLEVLDDVLKLNDRESHWARILNADYNIALAGQGMRGYKHTDEARQNMSKSHKGKIQHSDEYKQKLSERMKGNSWNKGRKQSPEWVEMMRGLHTGKIVSTETRAKRSAAMKGRPLTEEHKQKLRKPKRKKSLDENLKVCSVANISSWSDL